MKKTKKVPKFKFSTVKMLEKLIQNTRKALDLKEGEILTDTAAEIMKELNEYRAKFPNGFTSWQETHFEIVEKMTLEAVTENKPKTVLSETREAHGTGGVWELAKAWTNEFEKLHNVREWDESEISFYEAVEEFFNEKNNKI